MDAVGLTSRWVAAARARESERTDRLFDDPFARPLAGPEGVRMLEETERGTGENLYFALRTRFFDDFALEAAHSLRQITIFAAGMDARAFRLPWPKGTIVFEIEREQVLAVKEPILRDMGAAPRCDRRVVPADLAGHWQPSLLAAGFDPGAPALVLIEGLMAYLTKDLVETLLARISDIASADAKLCADIIGRSFLESLWTEGYRKLLREMGIEWHFGTDEPEQFLENFGWRATATMPGEPEANCGRWTYPVPPRDAAGFPKTYLVRATRPPRNSNR
jgi:methyltransferase (TIGR00027 family)